MSRRQIISVIIASAGVATAALIAGPTTPPAGPVASTYKTLAEVEPRRAVQSLPGSGVVHHIIDQPGSYYLTGNINGQSGKHGIHITAANVTIDLCGHSLAGVPGSLDGIIYSPGVSSVEIRNGVISGWGAQGVGLGAATGVRIDNLRVINCGDAGVYVGDSAIISESQAIGNTKSGFWVGEGSRIVDCSARGNHTDGFLLYRNTVVSGCTSTFNDKAGIAAYTGCTITGCTTSENLGAGIEGIQPGITISNCNARHNGGSGIRIESLSYVSGCTSSFNTGGGTGAGIYATGGANRIDSNMVNANDIGIKLDAGQNVVVRNTWSFNPTGIAAVAGNNVAQTMTTPGNPFNATNPWANFAH